MGAETLCNLHQASEKSPIEIKHNFSDGDTDICYFFGQWWETKIKTQWRVVKCLLLDSIDEP